jgi:hypothetical protein
MTWSILVGRIVRKTAVSTGIGHCFPWHQLRPVVFRSVPPGCPYRPARLPGKKSRVAASAAFLGTRLALRIWLLISGAIATNEQKSL